MAVENMFINLYTDDPTENREDGTLVSLNDDTSSPLAVTVNSSKEERKKIKMALRCKSGYQTNGDTTIWFSGPNADKWSVCQTEDGTYSSTLVLSSIVGTTNVIFYVQAAATKGELPDIDTTTRILVNTTIERVA